MTRCAQYPRDYGSSLGRHAQPPRAKDLEHLFHRSHAGDCSSELQVQQTPWAGKMGAMETERLIRLEVEGAVATVVLDRPPANVLGTPGSTQLAEAVAEIAARSEIRAVVVWGGERIFCGGADLKEMATFDETAAAALSDLLGGAIRALELLDVPTVAAIEGAALGGGLELALGCDLRVAAEGALLGQPEVAVGIIPGAGGTQRLPRAVGYDRAREMVLTGRRIAADEALSIGLVHRVVPTGTALAAATEMAQTFAAGPTRAYAAAKSALRAAEDIVTGLKVERDAFAALFATADRTEGMKAFTEKRPPMFEGR